MVWWPANSARDHNSQEYTRRAGKASRVLWAHVPGPRQLYLSRAESAYGAASDLLGAEGSEDIRGNLARFNRWRARSSTGLLPGKRAQIPRQSSAPTGAVACASAIAGN